MSKNTQPEFLRLISEPSTLTGRTPTTVLFLREGRRVVREERRGRRSSEAEDSESKSSRRVLVDSSREETARKVRCAITAAFEARGSVVLELLAAPHPSLYALLAQAREHASYDRALSAECSTSLAEIPAGCLIVVIADRDLVESQIRYPGFYNLFEVIECL